MSLAIGDKVRALRRHNKAVVLEGLVETIDGDEIGIGVTGAGVPHKIVPVEHPLFEAVHAADVTVVEKAKSKEEKKKS